MAYNFNLVPDEYDSPYSSMIGMDSGFQNPMMPQNPMSNDKGHPMYSLDFKSDAPKLSSVTPPAYDESIQKAYGMQRSNKDLLLNDVLKPIISNGIAMAVGGRRGLKGWLDSQAPVDELHSKQQFEKIQQLFNKPEHQQAYNLAVHDFNMNPDVDFSDELNRQLGLTQTLGSLGTGDVGVRTKAGIAAGHPLNEAAQAALDYTKKDNSTPFSAWQAQHQGEDVENYLRLQAGIDAGKRINIAQHIAPIEVNKAIATDYGKNQKYLGGIEATYKHPTTGMTYKLEHFDPSLDKKPGEPTLMEKYLPSIFGSPEPSIDPEAYNKRIQEKTQEYLGQSRVPVSTAPDKKKKKQSAAAKPLPF